MDYKGNNQEILRLEEFADQPVNRLSASTPSTLTFLWFKEGQSLTIDGEPRVLHPNDILCLTEFHLLEATTLKNIRLLQFNRAFYCIKDHDNEVSCKGLLFYSATAAPAITLAQADRDKFEILWKMFSIEMATADNLQFEMLQMMLKRFIILCTRIYKKQYPLEKNQGADKDIIREFHYLVEVHFKTQHSVAGYAAMLNKSPKTLANLFMKLGSGSPLALIQERIMLEARRLLRYSDKSVKEIAYELGYEDVQSFSRAFRQKMALNPTDFRNQKLTTKGSIAHTAGSSDYLVGDHSLHL